MKYALVEGERICQFVGSAKDCFPVAEPLTWVEVADTVTTQDRYVNGKVVAFVPPAPLSPPAPAVSDVERLLDALAAEGIVPAGKHKAVLATLKANR